MLTPNCTYTMNGVLVREKIIPDGTRWTDDAKAKKAGFSGAGELYKKNQKLSGNTGKAKFVTIHNTGDFANVYDGGELYTRATYNENMGSARVHFYIDETGAWQNLKAGTGLCSSDPLGAAEVSWHSGDGNVADGGNMTSISMELIMGVSSANDSKTYDNGARMAAWLLWRHDLSVEKLVTHTYWVNKTAKNKFSDIDEQCCHMVIGKKWCPTYIFNSYNHAVALKNWKAFKSLVKRYLDQLNGNITPTTPIGKSDETSTTIKVGDVVQIVGNEYYSGKAIPTWVKAKKWIVKSVSGKRVVIDKSEDGASSICSPVHSNALVVVRAATSGTVTFQVGDKVRCNTGATYSNGGKMPLWVLNATLYIRRIEQNGKVLLVSTEPVKQVYTGRVNASDVHKI